MKTKNKDGAYVFKATPYRLREGGALWRLGGRFGRLGAQSGRFSKAEGERFDA